MDGIWRVTGKYNQDHEFQDSTGKVISGNNL